MCTRCLKKVDKKCVSEPWSVLCLSVYVLNKTILTIYVNVYRVRSRFFESNLSETALNKINHHVTPSLTINYKLYTLQRSLIDNECCRGSKLIFRVSVVQKKRKKKVMVARVEIWGRFDNESTLFTQPVSNCSPALQSLLTSTYMLRTPSTRLMKLM